MRGRIWRPSRTTDSGTVFRLRSEYIQSAATEPERSSTAVVRHLLKIAIAAVTATAALTTTPLAISTKAEGIKMAHGVDVQVGRDRDDRYYRDRNRYDRDATVGVGPGGVTVGPRQRCRTVTTRVEGDDGRMITRKERRCD
jgi:hypothetical protein